MHSIFYSLPNRQAFYPGAVGGKAISDLLFGAFSPSAKLPYTLYKKV
jgi:beta-glucosidase